jgi:hypothetical protein
MAPLLSENEKLIIAFLDLSPTSNARIVSPAAQATSFRINSARNKFNHLLAQLAVTACHSLSQ